MTVKVERYAPGGGSNFVGVVGEEHAPPKKLHNMSETTWWCIWVGMVVFSLSGP